MMGGALRSAGVSPALASRTFG